MIKKLILFLFITYSGKTFAQVNLQTGSASFSLPMFNWQDNKSRLNSVVALNYSSGNGLKVNDVASNVGQGWNLLAGGVITRIQAGEPDDQLAFFNGTSEQTGDITKYPPGYLYNSVSPSLGAPVALTKYPIYKDKNHIYKQHNAVAADRELDRFAFQFNGRSGVFVLSKINSDLANQNGVGVFLGDSKMKVTFATNNNMTYQGQKIRTTITSFTIYGENGLIYKFANYELTKLLKIDYCDASLNRIRQPKFKKNKVYHEASYDDGSIENPYVISGWYLTEIEDALTHTKINFNYASRNISTTGGTAISNYTSNNSGIFTPEKNYSVISHLKSVTKGWAISSINFPDGHAVTFNYGKQRIDVNGDSILSSVNIIYQGRYLSKYQLTTAYFILNRYGIPTSDYQKKCARLCLRSVKKIGVDLKADDPPYTFDYYLGTSDPYNIVPPPFFHLKDIWGFYNGNNSQNYDGQSIPVYKSLFNLDNKDLKGLCFYNRNNIYNAKTDYAKNGLLKQITYPTGGSLNYDYEQNTILLDGQSTNASGVHVSRTSITDGGYDNNCNNPIATIYKYNLEGSNQSSLWGMESSVNSLKTYNYYLPKDKFFYYRPPISFGCDFRYKYPGILSREQAVNVPLLMQMIQTALKIYGVVSDMVTVLKVIGGADPVTMIIQIVLEIALTCIGDHHVDNETTIYYNSDLNSSNPLPVQFKRVEVMEGSGNNGKTVYEFTSDTDYPIWVPQNIYKETFSAEQRYGYWSYGLPKLITVKDAIGNPVKQTENRYNNIERMIGDFKLGEFSGYPSCKSLVIKSSSQKHTDWEDAETYNPYDVSWYPSANFTKINNAGMNVRMYGVYSGRMELDSTYERVFKQGSASQFIETVTAYTYSSYNYQVKTIITTESNGDKNFKQIDYSGEGYGTLAQNNILNIPVHTITGIIKNGNSAIYYLGEKNTEFTSIPNGDIKPFRILEKRFSQPTTNLDVPYKEIQLFTYDAEGNLRGMKDEGNHVVTNIYDYDDKYVVASVVNAEPLIDKPAYTSFETQNLGGWLAINGTNYITSSSVTGARSFSLSSSRTLFTTLNTAKPYTVSFWSTSGVSVTNSTLVKSAPAINDFTYYEYNISQGSSSVTIGGNATVDELRLYPKTARMRTVTYDPLIGKTAECDENNRITYYEYDNHGRLRFIKDENRNVVKMYEYNIAKKPMGCPVTYFNLAVSEVFTRQSEAGYEGGDITYIIPQGKYTSTVSQEAVDQQVQNELETYGQSYANTNGSLQQLFYNSVLLQTFTKEACPIGYEGSSYTYTVPAGSYSSTISQAEADEQAQDDMDGNGQTLANLPENGSCVVSYAADWIGTEVDRCENGHRMVEIIDQNPNSSSYNQIQWLDVGADASCGTATCDASSCSGVDKRCVIGTNGTSSCETGYKIYTSSIYDETLNRWICTYHYEWNDDYWSGDYTEYSYSKCHFIK